MSPIFILSVDELPITAIGLIVRTDRQGTTGEIRLPAWLEIPAMFDGPHRIQLALSLARDYAEAYGYRAILVDIESSQLWSEEWGRLER